MRVTWDDTGKRYYETGIDRGMLYVGSTSAAWSGITAVEEKTSGGEAQPYYLEGLKVSSPLSSEEFEATLTAFSAPAEFAPCDGNVTVTKGLVATQQPRKAFHLSYRTMIGNDVNGTNEGYKIHFVYNVLASPSGKNYRTISENVELVENSWDLTTLPASLTGYKPTAHYIVDSRSLPPKQLAYLEDTLYGSDTQAPRMLMPSELVAFLNDPGQITRRNLHINPAFRKTNPDLLKVEIRRNLFKNPDQSVDLANLSYWAGVGGAVTMTRETTGGFHSPTCVKYVWTTAPTSGGGVVIGASSALGFQPVVAGKSYVCTAYLKSSVAVNIAPQGQLYLDGTPTVAAGANATISVPANVYTKITFLSGVIPTGSNQLQIRFYFSGFTPAVGHEMYLSNILFEEADGDLNYFDGSRHPYISTYSNTTVSWTGTAGASESIMTGYAPYNAPVSAYTASPGVVGWMAGPGLYRVCFKKKMTAGIFMFSGTYCKYITTSAGEYYTGRFKIRFAGSTYSNLSLTPYLYSYNTASSSQGYIANAGTVTLPNFNTTWQDVALKSYTACPADSASCRWYISIPSGSNIAPGTTVEFTDMLVEKVLTTNVEAGPYFDGNTPDANGYIYEWEGEVDNSTSIIKTWN